MKKVQFTLEGEIEQHDFQRIIGAVHRELERIWDEEAQYSWVPPYRPYYFLDRRPIPMMLTVREKLGGEENE